jgi:hypothetical protein
MNDKYIQTDVPGLVKDRNSGAILNVDNLKLKAYRQQKKLMTTQTDANQRLDQLEGDVADIKDMLSKILELVANK